MGRNTASSLPPASEGDGSRVPRWWVLAVAVIVGTIAALTVYGWLVGSAVPFKMLVSFPPMQLNTAVLFLLTSVGLSVLYFQRKGFASGVGAMILIFSLASLIQYAGHHFFKIEPMLHNPSWIVFQTAVVSRMSPQSAFNFILTGFCLLFCAGAKDRCQTGRLFLAACIFTFSISAMLGYFFNLESASGWGAMTRMSLPAALSFFLTALGLLAVNWKGGYRFWPAALVFFSGLLMSFFVLQVMSSSSEAHIRTIFTSDARDRVLSLNRHLEYAHRTLQGVRAFYEGSKSVERDEFKAFLKRSLEDVQSIQAIEWVESVPGDQRDRFEHSLQTEGFKGLHLKELSEDGRFIPAKNRAQYYPVTYTEPFRMNEKALGFDQGSHPACKEAIDRARDENVMTATEPFHLFRETDKEAKGFLIIEPIYKNDADLSTLEGRRDNFIGVLEAVIRLPRFVARTLAYVTPKPLQFYLFDATRPSRPVLAYASSARFSREQLEAFAREDFSTLPGLTYTEKVDFSSREYLVLIHAEEPYLGRHQTWYPSVTFFLMLLLSIAATSFVVQEISRSRDLERFTSELRQTRDASESARNSLQAVLDAATDVSIISTDIQGMIKVFNRGAEKILGWKASEMIDLQTPERIHLLSEVQNRGAELSAVFGKKIEGFDVFVEYARRGAAEEREWTYVRKDGSHLTVSLVVTAVYNAQRQISGFLGIAIDITQRKQMEQDLKAAGKTAMEASRAKSDFLAAMSHEIRTPLNAILGMAELLSETPLTEDQRRYVLTLSRGGETLLAVINDILDLSKIESGVIELENAVYSVKEMTERVVEVLAIAAHRKSIELTFVTTPDMPEMVEGDASRVRQVLMNLIGNAIKFTEKGKVMVTLSRTGNQLNFFVSDTGIGIPEDKQEKIFNPFTQADSSTTRKYGGTGLGLSISKKLVTLMGGKIGVESRPGAGSRFYFFLPLRIPARNFGTAGPEVKNPADSNAARLSEMRRRILLAEDSIDNQELLTAYLKNHHYDVDIAENGQIALEKAMLERYDLILMDIQMPEMDGYTATQLIRARDVKDSRGRRIKIIALTANALQNEAEKCLAAGCDAYLSKPIKKTVLLEALAGYLSGLEHS